MASREGGMEIEEVAARDPEAIFKEWIDPDTASQGFQARKLAFFLGLEGNAFKKRRQVPDRKLYKAFVALDCSMAEINPLVVTQGRRR
jgi:succinyl-CoA synthetase beta subunit